MSSVGFVIREADSSDIPVIKAMAEVVFRDTYREILSPEQLEYMMEWMYSKDSLSGQMGPLGHRFFIAYDGERPCAYASFNRESELLFHFQKLYVMPHSRGCGLGRILFRRVLDEARAAAGQPCTVELNVNRHNKAVGFYERMGMEKVREGDFPIGNGFNMNDYIMAVEA